MYPGVVLTPLYVFSGPLRAIFVFTLRDSSKQETIFWPFLFRTVWHLRSGSAVLSASSALEVAWSHQKCTFHVFKGWETHQHSYLSSLSSCACQFVWLFSVHLECSFEFPAPTWNLLKRKLQQRFSGIGGTEDNSVLPSYKQVFQVTARFSPVKPLLPERLNAGPTGARLGVHQF